MDAFIIKTPKSKNDTISQNLSNLSSLTKNNPSKNENSGALNKIKISPDQRKLTDLKGVISLEVIKDAVTKLSDSNIPAKEKLIILLKIKKKLPATEIIKSSGIGKVVRKLAKLSNHEKDHDTETLITEASKLYQKWKKTVEKRVDVAYKAKYVEVEYDAATKQMRKNAISLMQNAATMKINKNNGKKKAPFEIIPETTFTLVERYIFELHNRRTDKEYRKSIRKIVFAIRYDKDDIRNKLFRGRNEKDEKHREKSKKAAKSFNIEDILREYLR